MFGRPQFVAFLFIFLQSYAASVQAQCALSGRTIISRSTLCLSTGCKNYQEKLTIIGHKILSYEESGNVGSIYYIGKTVEATADPSQQNDASTLKPRPGVGQQQVFLTALQSPVGLVLKEETIFRNRRPPSPDLTVILVTTISTTGCNACAVKLHFLAKFANGVTEEKEGAGTFCAIIHAQ